MTEYKTFDDYVRNILKIEPTELTHISPEEQKKKTVEITVDELINIWNELTELKADNDARKFAMAMSEKVEKQLREENAELRKEWQEQVQKATDEGYARTLQTIQLTKATEIIKKFLLWENDWHDKTESKYELLKQAEQFLKDSEVEK